MTSKNLFFKLMKEDIRNRIWAVALISLGCFFFYPVAAAFMAGNMKDYQGYDRALLAYTRDMKNLLAFDNGFTLFVMSVASLICGLSSFSYLNSKSKVDFYHSLPVRREKLYLANYLDGILFLALPYGLSVVMAVVIGSANGVDAGMLCWHALAACGLHIIYFILMYTVVVLAAMMTGNLVVGFMGTMVFWFYMPLLFGVIQGCFIAFFPTYYAPPQEELFSFGMRISPMVQYFWQIDQYGSPESRTVASALAALGISAVLAGTGCFLYQKRPSEAAGRAMAFKISCPIIRICICMLSALCLGLMFWGMQESSGWLAFGSICGAVISHCVIEIIYNFDFKKLFSHWVQMAVCVAASLVIMLSFRYDIAGYDTYLPQSGQVESTAISIGIMNNWVSYGEMKWDDEDEEYFWNPAAAPWEEMQCQEIDAVLGIAQSGIQQTALSKKEKYYKDEDTNIQLLGADGPTSVFVAGKTHTEKPLEEWSRVVVRYTLRGGRNVYRGYYMNLAQVGDMVDRVCTDPSYLQATFPLMARGADEVAVLSYREQEEQIGLDSLDAGAKEELLATYQKEFSALGVEQMRSEFPVGLIRFSTYNYEEARQWWDSLEGRKRKEERGWYYDSWMNEDYYPLYPSFTGTIELLERYGIEPGSYEQGEEISFVTVVSYEDRYDGSRTAVISAPEEVELLRAVLKDEARRYYAPIFLAEGPEAVIHYKKGNGEDGRSMIFPKGEVPGFVYERLEEEGE